MRGATDYHKAMFGTSKDFNPRSSCEERHVRSAYRPKVEYHFNPRSSCEERHHLHKTTVLIKEFQSTLLMRGATARTATARRAALYFNPRSSCEERHDGILIAFSLLFNFNPRSSCEERRYNSGQAVTRQQDFNPRSSCEERREKCMMKSSRSIFQSTLLMRGATSERSRCTFVV